MKKTFASWIAWLAPLSPLLAQQPQTVPSGTQVTITATPAGPTTPLALLHLGPRHSHVTPERHGCTHVSGGNVGVAQLTRDAVVIKMTGAVVA